MKGRATFIMGVMMVNTVLSVPTPACGSATVTNEVYNVVDSTYEDESGVQKDDSHTSPEDDSIIEFDPELNVGDAGAGTGGETTTGTEATDDQESELDDQPVSDAEVAVPVDNLPTPAPTELESEETVLESVYMAPMYAQLPSPSQPEVLLQDEQAVTLHWNLPTGNWRSLQGFRIYRSLSPEGIFERVGQVGRSSYNFTDEGLVPGTTYYYRIVSMSENDLESRPSPVTEVTTKVDVTRPWVLKWTPNAAKKVGIYAPVAVTFDDYMQADTINNFSFYVTDKQTKQVVPGTVTYLESEHKAVFTPTSALAIEQTYEVTLTDGITNISNLPLETFTYTFTTTTFTSPHGGYEVSTAGCASCHTTHASEGAQLLNGEDTVALCMSCHNGEGSNVILVQDKAAHRELRECTECHDPHVPKTGVGTGGGGHPKGSS